MMEYQGGEALVIATLNAFTAVLSNQRAFGTLPPSYYCGFVALITCQSKSSIPHAHWLSSVTVLRFR